MPPARRRDPGAAKPDRPGSEQKERAGETAETARLEGRLRQRYRLTQCEAQVARYVADGLRYSEIAERLGVSYHTVHSHVKAIHSKTGVTSNGRVIALIRSDPRP